MKAKSENLSVNTLVENALADLVKDVRSEAELEEERKATAINGTTRSIIPCMPVLDIPMQSAVSDSTVH